MNKYHVGCGTFGIYAGKLKSENEWKDKTECTDEAVCAVRDYMVDKLLGGLKCTKAQSGAWGWTLKDGRIVELSIAIK